MVLSKLCRPAFERTHVFFLGSFLSKQSSFGWSSAHNLDIYTLRSLPYHQCTEDLFGLCRSLWRLPKIPQKHLQVACLAEATALWIWRQRGHLAGGSFLTMPSKRKKTLARTTACISAPIPTPGVPGSAVLVFCSVCLSPIKFLNRCCWTLSRVTCPSTATPNCKARLLVLSCLCKRSEIT